MSKELVAALDELERVNGISKEVMFDAIEKSLFDEYKNQFNTVENARVTLDRITGDFHIYSERVVVEKVEAVEPKNEKGRRMNEKYVSATEISLADARKINPFCNIGDLVSVEIKSDEFSRRAAKNAKGVIVQKIREEEKAVLYNEYHSKEREIITGIVQRIDDRGNVVVDIGRMQTTLKTNDQVKGEEYHIGDRIKLLVVSVTNKDKSGTMVRVSRSSPALVERLFEEEVSEIKDGIVEIMGIAREAGSRTKMAVRAKVPNVDPVGACVGVNGARVKAIVNELGNEQIDIIEWNENPAQLIVNSLSPAKVVSAVADDDEKKAQIVVSEQQLSLAIGKAGQNVRLAAKLTGFGIDIKSEAQMNEAAGSEDIEAVEETELSADDNEMLINEADEVNNETVDAE